MVDIDYDPAGNITGKSDQADQYLYSATQPNRLTSIKNSAGTTPAP